MGRNHKLGRPSRFIRISIREISDSGVGDEHISGNAKDTTAGISTVKYIFRNVYGSIPDNQGGQQLAFNLITAAQKQRAREVFERHATKASTDDPLALVQYLDLKTYLVGDINTKVDRASMAHSLEVREPLMDHELVEWMATQPSSLKVRGQEGKFLLKKAFEPSLPKDILYRPKMGFAVPLARWFRGPLRERVREAVLGPRLAETGWFNQEYLRHLVDAHQSGVSDYSAPLWTVLMFEAFLRNVLDAPTDQAVIVAESKS